MKTKITKQNKTHDAKLNAQKNKLNRKLTLQMQMIAKKTVLKPRQAPVPQEI